MTLKKHFVLFLLAAWLTQLAPWAHADEDSDVGTGSGSSPTQGTGRGGGRRGARGGSSSKQADGASPGTVRGTCSVVASATNPFPGPCVNLLMILNDSQGSEQARSRTNAQGQFEFAASSGKGYRVVPGSKYYDIVSPSTVVHGGDKIDLKLQQKE